MKTTEATVFCENYFTGILVVTPQITIFRSENLKTLWQNNSATIEQKQYGKNLSPNIPGIFIINSQTKT